MSSDALRVLLVPSAYYPHVGGIEETTRQLAAHLRGRGHAAAILTNRWPAGTAARGSWDGVPVRRVTMELPGASPRRLVRFAARAPRAAAEVVQLTRAFRPDVLHLIGAGPNAAYALALRRFVRAPIVLTAQGEFTADAEAVFERSLTLRTSLRRLLSVADAVTACSRFVIDELERELPIGVPAEVVPNGVDLAELADGTREHDLGAYVFAAGRLVPQKAFDTLLRAFAAAGDDLRNTKLVIAGDGPDREALHALGSELGLNGSVVWLGAVDRKRLASLMRGARAFAFPSRVEAFGIALLEAMAAGTPAVAARAGGIPEFARDGENALLVPPDDVVELARALRRAVHDEFLRARLARGARATAAAHGWSEIATRYEDVYRKAIGA